jgi:hypothetical protein
MGDPDLVESPLSDRQAGDASRAALIYPSESLY